MENCSICNSDYKKAYKSDHLKSIKHLQKLNQYYCKKCNTFMPLSDKSNHLNSDEHKNETKQQREATQIWCEDCGKYISNSRHFQSEIHTLRSQNNATKNAFGNTLHGVGTGVEIIVNEKTYIKLRVSPTNHLEEQINDLLNKNYFPRYKFQLSYLAKFSKIVNGQSFAEEIVFHKWVKSDFNYSHTQIAFGTNPNIHNILMQKLDDEQLEGSGFVLNGIVNVILEVYKVNDIQASSWVELPEKYRNNKSIINIKNDDQFCFLWCILSHLFPVEDHKNRTSNYSMHTNKLISNGLEFPMKIKDIPKFENLNNLNVNVFELTKTVLTPIHINTNYDQPQIDLLLYQNHYCLITKLHCLINKDSHMKWECRRCLTAFSSEDILSQHSQLGSLYEASIATDIEKGYVSVVPDSEANREDAWYLPHHPVTNVNKPGKIRRVTNASSVYQGTSLNFSLLKGPDLLCNLTGLIMRFREKCVALSADIEAMFMQVSVPPSDRRFLRYLWRNEVHEYNRHIFGATDSPCAACYAVRQCAEDNKTAYPDAPNLVARHIYMDDLYVSTDTLEEAKNLRTVLQTVLATGGFNLTKWTSNNLEFNQSIPESDRSNSAPINPNKKVIDRVLGVKWNTIDDCYLLEPTNFQDTPKKLTQRTLLKYVSSIFDSLGMSSPIQIRVRTSLQQIWKGNQHWDRPIALADYPELKNFFRRCSESFDSSHQAALFRSFQATSS